jgi:hypothetical protein
VAGNARKSIPKRVAVIGTTGSSDTIIHNCSQVHAEAILKNVQPCVTTDTVQTYGKAYKNADTQFVSSWMPKAASDKVTDGKRAAPSYMGYGRHTIL